MRSARSPVDPRSRPTQRCPRNLRSIACDLLVPVRISRVLSPPHDVDKDGSADREASSLESASCRASCRASYRATPRAAFRAATLRRTTGATSVPSSSIARSTRSCGIGPTVS